MQEGVWRKLWNCFCQGYLVEFHLTHILLLDDSFLFLSAYDTVGVYRLIQLTLTHWANPSGLAAS